jgi:hypothetical protein
MESSNPLPNFFECLSYEQAEQVEKQDEREWVTMIGTRENGLQQVDLNI